MYKDYDKGYEESYRELVEFRKGISLTWILGMEDFPEKNSVGGEWGRVLQAENIMHSKALRRGSRAASSNLRASVAWTQRTDESRDFPFNTQYSPSK